MDQIGESEDVWLSRRSVSPGIGVYNGLVGVRRGLTVAVFLLALAAPILWLSPALFEHQAPVFRDQGDFFYPLKLYTAARLAAGGVPLWNPLSGSGGALARQRSVGSVLSADSLLPSAVFRARGCALPARSLLDRGLGSLAVSPRGRRFGAGRPRLRRPLCRKRVCCLSFGVLEPLWRIHVHAGDRGPGALRLALAAVGRGSRPPGGTAGHGGQPRDLRSNPCSCGRLRPGAAIPAADGLGRAAPVAGTAAVVFWGRVRGSRWRDGYSFRWESCSCTRTAARRCLSPTAKSEPSGRPPSAHLPAWEARAAARRTSLRWPSGRSACCSASPASPSGSAARWRSCFSFSRSAER